MVCWYMGRSSSSFFGGWGVLFGIEQGWILPGALIAVTFPCPVGIARTHVDCVAGYSGAVSVFPVKHDLHEIINAILYVNRTGIAWEADGITQTIYDLLREAAQARRPYPFAIGGHPRFPKHENLDQCARRLPRH